MNILFVVPYLDAIVGGGTTERTIQLARAALKLGHSCAILATHQDLTDARRRELSELRLITVPCVSSRFYIPWASPWRIAGIVKDFDVIHLVGHWGALNALVAPVCWWKKKKYTVTPAGSLRIFGRSSLLKKIYNHAIGYRLIRRANAHFAITADETGQFSAYGVNPANVRVLCNGINPDDYLSSDEGAFRALAQIPATAPFALFLGRLNLIKGPDLLLEAFIRARDSSPGMHLVFAGQDEGFLPILRERTKEAGIADRVHFAGFVAGKTKSWALHAASFLVIPSRSEAMSIVVLEAGACGRPVLLTEACGFSQLEPMGAGTVVPADIEGLTRGLKSMFLKNPDQLEEMGRRLKAEVLARYTWLASGKSLIEFLERA